MTERQRARAQVLRGKFDKEELDDLVMDAKAQEAEDLNERGETAQLHYLITAGVLP